MHSRHNIIKDDLKYTFEKHDSLSRSLVEGIEKPFRDVIEKISHNLERVFGFEEHHPLMNVRIICLWMS
jgi:hypothetical protein